MEPERILVIKLKHIGDVLLATPSIRALKAAYPSSRIFALVSAGTEEMLTGNPDLEEVLIFKKGRGVGRIMSEVRLLREVRRVRPDLVVEMGNGDREAILGFLSGARIRVGYNPGRSGFFGRRFLLTHMVPQDWRKHVVESNLDLVRALGIEPREKALRLFVHPKDVAVVQRLLREMGVGEDDVLVTIHPTSRWLFKGWTDEGFAQVADHLSRRGVKVIITGGPAPKEVEKAKRVVMLTRWPVVDLIGRLTLKELAALIARSRLFIGVDSAPMHIACAVNTPVVALFGPSGEHNWAPWGDGHLVLKRDQRCRPLGRSLCEVTKRCECLETLTAAEVIAAVESQLSSGEHRPRPGPVLSLVPGSQALHRMGKKR